MVVLDMTMYDVAREAFMKGDIDWVNDTIGILLFGTLDADPPKALASLNSSVEDVLSHGTTAEVAGGNYARKTLSNKSVFAQTSGNGGAVYCRSDGVIWTALTHTSGSFNHWLIYADAATDALRIPIANGSMWPWPDDQGLDFWLTPHVTHGWINWS